jgi:hypothetical protein
MINPGYAIRTEDVKTMRGMKGTAAYSNYLKNIAQSPAFTAIMDEHINNIDITPDIQRLQNEKMLPQDIKIDALNTLFKQSIARMAIGITADSVILKELENVRIQDVINGINDDFNVTYLIGKAPKETYNKVAEMVDKGEISEDSLLYKGLLSYMRNNQSKINVPDVTPEIKEPPKPTKKTSKRKEQLSIDYNSDNIEI